MLTRRICKLNDERETGYYHSNLNQAIKKSGGGKFQDIRLHPAIRQVYFIKIIFLRARYFPACNW